MSAATRTEERSLEPKRLRRVLVGRPMQTGQIHETLLPKWLALPIFASDPLSSVAYATESALVVLVAVSDSTSAVSGTTRRRYERPGRRAGVGAARTAIHPR